MSSWAAPAAGPGSERDLKHFRQSDEVVSIIRGAAAMQRDGDKRLNVGNQRTSSGRLGRGYIGARHVGSMG